MRYRDKNETIANILKSADGNRVRLKKIMYGGHLSRTLAKQYLVLLIEKGLIEYLDDGIFKTTEKGLNFLRIHNRVQELGLLTIKLQRKRGVTR